MAPVDTFWTTNGTGATRLIEATPGDAITQPYTILPGSGGVDFTNPQVWVDARLLFDDIVLDTAGLYPDRPDFDTATFTDFMAWHSRHQVDYILEKGTEVYSPDPGAPVPDPLPVGTRTVNYVTFADGGTFVLGQDSRTIYHVESLKLTDFASMPLADQEALAGPHRMTGAPGDLVNIFQGQAADLLVRPASIIVDEGLPTEAIVYETVEDVRNEMILMVEALIADITAATDYDATDRDEFLSGFLFDANLRVSHYPHFFVEELELYKLRLNGMALFSPARISDFLEDLEERFLRIKSYFDVSPETASTSGGLIGGVNSFDKGATMSNGLGIFVEMESQLFQIALARAYVTATGTLIEPVKGKLMSSQALVDAAYDSLNSTYLDFGTFVTDQATDIYGRTTSGASNQKLLDGPNLIFVLQTFSNYEAEAEAQIKSEDLNQQTRILEDYSRMQKLVNETLNKFEPVPDVDDEETAAETLALLDLTNVSQLTDDQKRVASMFDTTASKIGNTYHPTENKKSPGYPADFRPTVEIASGALLKSHEKTIWDGLAVKIGDATKIIGQDSQVQMDAINRLSQQKNRHYDLGSNVLNKMTELLRDITS